jgi:hypothetical protein
MMQILIVSWTHKNIYANTVIPQAKDYSANNFNNYHQTRPSPYHLMEWLKDTAEDPYKSLMAVMSIWVDYKL